MFTPAYFPMFSSEVNTVNPCALGERDDHAVERIPVEQWQGGRRARDAGIERSENLGTLKP